jgi:hypothetical protein
MTLTERFALQLFMADLNVNEVAQALSWTVPETQTFRNKLRAIVSPQRSGPGRRKPSSS